MQKTLLPQPPSAVAPPPGTCTTCAGPSCCSTTLPAVTRPGPRWYRSSVRPAATLKIRTATSESAGFEGSRANFSVILTIATERSDAAAAPPPPPLPLSPPPPPACCCC